MLKKGLITKKFVEKLSGGGGGGRGRGSHHPSATSWNLHEFNWQRKHFFKSRKIVFEDLTSPVVNLGNLEA